MIDILNILNDSISSASQWFLDIFTASGATEVYISVIFIVLVIKFIVVPFMGSSKGSDTARKKESEDG